MTRKGWRGWFSGGLVLCLVVGLVLATGQPLAAAGRPITRSEPGSAQPGSAAPDLAAPGFPEALVEAVAGEPVRQAPAGALPYPSENGERPLLDASLTERPAKDAQGPRSATLEPYAPGQVLVKFRANAGSDVRQVYRDSRGLSLLATMPGRDEFELLGLPSGTSVRSAVRSLVQAGVVEYVQPNYRYLPDAAPPDDPLFFREWGLESSMTDVDLDVLDAWDYTQGDPSVIVAVIDTGIDISHPDLAGRIWTNPGETPGDGVDNDGNGYVDDVNGWHFLYEDGTYLDDNTVFEDFLTDYHGTHVAGTIAAVSDNGIGVAGVAPGVTIMPLKFIGPDGGYTWDAVRAVDYATDKGAKIINASWGGGGYDAALEEVIADFGDAGGIFVAAAGNSGLDNDNTPHYPSSYSLPNIISVAATDMWGDLAYFSNFGATSVDIVAPGVDVVSTLPEVPTYDYPGAVTATGPEGYRAVLWGFGAEGFNDTVEGAAAREDAVGRAMGYLAGGATISDVLLVDEDGSNTGDWEDVRDSYLIPLQDLGYNVTVDEPDVGSEGPSADFMSGYDAVVWITGERYGPPWYASTLTPTEVSELETYLSGGGRLFLAGQDAVYRSEETNLVHNYLHVDFVMEWDGPLGHQGLVGTGGAYEGADYSGQWSGDVYYDFFHVLDEDYATGVLVYEGRSYDTAYGSLSGTSMAAPHVSGTAALVLSQSPGLDYGELVGMVLGYTQPFAHDRSATSSGGLVNARLALGAGSVPGVTFSSAMDMGREDWWDNQARYMVVLDSAPTANVTVKASSDARQVKVAPSALVFTPDNWYVPQTFTATAVDDLTCENPGSSLYPYHISTINHAVSGGNYSGLYGQPFADYIWDNDMLVIKETRGSTTVREGDYDDTYTVALPFRPDEEVRVETETWSDEDITLTPSELWFTPEDWNVPQTITVSATDDPFTEPTWWYDGGHILSGGGSNYRYLVGWWRYLAIFAIDNDGPRPPRFLSAQADADGVLLSWLPPVGGPEPVDYRVEVSSNGKDFVRLATTVSPEPGDWTAFVVTPDLTADVGYTLTPGRKHVFRVVSTAFGGAWRVESRASLPATAVAGPMPPAAPKKLVAAPGPDGVVLTWEVPAGYPKPDGFQVTLFDPARPLPTVFEGAVWDGGPTASLTLTREDYDFADGLKYSFVAQAYVEPEVGPLPFLASKPSNKATTIPGPIAPAPPTSLKAWSTMTGVYLTWKPPTKGITPTGYEVRDISHDPPMRVMVDWPYVDWDLGNFGETNSLEVWSYVMPEGGGDPIYSTKPVTVKCATGSPAATVSPPTSVKVVPSNDCLLVTWQEPAKGVLPCCYEIRVSTTGAPDDYSSVKQVWREEGVGPALSCEVSAEDLAGRAIPYDGPGSQYYVEVMGVGFGEPPDDFSPAPEFYSLPSKPVLVKAGPAPLPPASLKATTSFEGVLLTWQPPKGKAPDGYRIYLAQSANDKPEDWIFVADVATGSWLTPVPSYEVTPESFGDLSVLYDGKSYIFFVYSLVDDPAGGEPVLSAKFAKASAKAGDWE